MLYSYDKTIDQLVPAGELAYYGPAGRAIGELVWTLLPVRAAGFQLLDGSLIYSTGIYAAFYNYIVQLKNTGEHDNLFVTETAWQQSVTTYGVCGKFVLDTTAGTVRIPKVTGHVEGTIDKNAVGDLIEAGLPNITGEYARGGIGSDRAGLIYRDYDTSIFTGAFIKGPTEFVQSIANATNNQASVSLGFDASRSSPIYGNSETVQTQSIKGYIYIIVGTYAKSDLQVNIDNVAGDLSHQGARITVVEDRVHIVETWQSGTSWYRVWSDGWIEQGGLSTKAIANTRDQITLFKAMSNTNYSVHVSQQITAQASNSFADANIPGYKKLSKTQIELSSRYYSGNVEASYIAWKVCGF